MKKQKLSLFLFILLLGKTDLLSDDSHKKQEGINEGASISSNCGDVLLPQTWDGISVLAVQFVAKTESGTLISNFSSPKMLQKFEFELPKKTENIFFEVDDDWEEIISKRRFLKRFKRDYWLVAYIPSEGGKTSNILCEAHQFKIWGSLGVTFAQNPNNLAKSVDTVRFWMNLKVKPIFFYKLRDDVAYWLFLSPTEEVVPEKLDERNAVKLADGEYASPIIRFADGSRSRILDHGTLKIDPNCVFNTVENKGPKIKVANMAILGKPKIRVRPLSRSYFEKNFLYSQWLCYYDNETKTLIRAVELDPGQEEEKKSEDKNGEKQKMMLRVRPK